MAVHSRITAAGLQAEAAAAVAGVQLRIAKLRFGSGHTVPTASTTGITTPLVPPQETGAINFAAAADGAYELGAEVHGSAEFNASEMELVLADDTVYAVIVDDTGDLFGKNTTQVPVLLIKIQFANPADASTLVATVNASNALLSATETTRGAVALASTAEAVAGQNADKAMTPATTDAAIGQNAKIPVRRIYTAGATWAKPDGLAWLDVEAWGGGAGGAVVPGGGGGAYAKRVIPAADLGATEAVVVGAGGTGVTGNGENNIAVTGGGNSSFGTHLTAYGGQRGYGGTVLRDNHGAGGGWANALGANAFGGGEGAYASSAAVSVSFGGGGGGIGSSDDRYNSGGVSIYGGGGGDGNSNGAGADGSVPAGGGGGGTTIGGNGARGEVRIVEYYA